MNKLDEILAAKRIEVKTRRQQKSIQQLVDQTTEKVEKRSFSKSIKNGNGIVAEFKRQSPSAGAFNTHSSLEDVLNYYSKFGVSAYSILTDEPYFKGRLEDLQKASKLVDKPVLRKDFIIDEYQIFEAKAFGADAILLIAEALEIDQAKDLTTVAKSLGLEVLMEFHSPDSLDRYNEGVDVVGVNNRNLKTLVTDVQASIDMFRDLPSKAVKISESGIHSATQIQKLKQIGYDGFLMGEFLLKSRAENGISQIINQASQTI